MADDLLAAALDRLERAVARLEAAGRPAGTPADDARAAAHARLAERHDRLRLRIQAVIGQLDAMVATPPAAEPAA